MKKLFNKLKTILNELRLNEYQKTIFVYKDKNKESKDWEYYKFQQDKRFKFNDESIDFLILSPKIDITREIVNDIERILKPGGYYIQLGLDGIYPFNFFRHDKKSVSRISKICENERLYKKKTYRVLINLFNLYFILVTKKERLAKVNQESEIKIQELEFKGSIAGATMYKGLSDQKIKA